MSNSLIDDIRKQQVAIRNRHQVPDKLRCDIFSYMKLLYECDGGIWLHCNNWPLTVLGMDVEFSREECLQVTYV